MTRVRRWSALAGERLAQPGPTKISDDAPLLPAELGLPNTKRSGAAVVKSLRATETWVHQMGGAMKENTQCVLTLLGAFKLN